MREDDADDDDGHLQSRHRDGRRGGASDADRRSIRISGAGRKRKKKNREP